MSKKYQLLVFDWDGTLMDSEGEIIHCFHAAAADLELPIPSEDEIRNIIGIGMQQAISRLFPKMQAEADRDALVERYRHYYFDPARPPAPLFDGVMAMLQALQDDGYMLGVATSKGRRGLDMALARTGLDRVFHYTRCIDEAHSKPHPQMLLDILDFTGSEVADALMIGDSEYDLQMANNAGVDGVGVCCGAHSEDRLRACKPVECLPHTTQLRQWLNQL
jgi:phosphoglycolate phosphatase